MVFGNKFELLVKSNVLRTFLESKIMFDLTFSLVLFLPTLEYMKHFVFSDAMTMIKLSNNNRTTFYVDNVLHSHYNLCLMGYDLPTNLLNSFNKETVKANNVE